MLLFLKNNKENKLSIVSLNSNIKNDIVLSGVMTGTSKIFHLNNSGDLLLTTSKLMVVGLWLF